MARILVVEDSRTQAGELRLLQTGKMPLRNDRLDLARLTRDTVADYRGVFEQAGLAVAVDVPQTPVWVHGDAARLAQVLHNLVDNSIKFGRRGGQVAVSLAPDQNRSWAILIVRDDGAGIEPETLARLFE